MIEDDVRVLDMLFPHGRWTAMQVALRPAILNEAALATLFADNSLQFGWVVQTGAVSCFDGSVWRTKDGDKVTTPWQQLLHAELAFADERGVRLTLLRDRQWRCEEAKEGSGETCLATNVSHLATWGRQRLDYRVYWALRRTIPGPERPECYQPIACRLLAEP